MIFRAPLPETKADIARQQADWEHFCRMIQVEIERANRRPLWFWSV
jgi:hypothetical protein